MGDIYEQSVELHRKFRGKLAVSSKVKLQSREDLSLAYTPGVARVSQEIAADVSKARELTFKGNSVAVVTDGSAILGLGNLGPEAALPVMEGKAVLFKEFAGIDAVPICLGTQDVEGIISAVKAIAPTFGGINLEDISAPRCFEVERRLKAELSIPVVHDDQHGTATVVLAALINALKLKGLARGSAKVVINGAGAAGVAVARLLLTYGVREVTVCDSKGIISRSRSDLTGTKRELAEQTNPEGRTGGLSEALEGADVFVGVSVAGALAPDLLKGMAGHPVVFALANPVPEIMPDEARSAGAYVVATGRSDFPNQINNVLAFPGIFRGALDRRVKQVTDGMLIRASENLAACVKDLEPDRILPSVLDRGVATRVAEAIG